jgi:hypothetical protein
MIELVILVNKQGQTKLARYYRDWQLSANERQNLEAELARRCVRSIGTENEVS